MELCQYPCQNKIRYFTILAIQIPIVYNRYGDHDPDGLIFVPLEDVDLVLAGKYTPKPLILRANVGDWLEVILHNVWDPNHMSLPTPFPCKLADNMSNERYTS